MAYAKKCDRCGKFYDISEINDNIRISVNPNPIICSWEPIDLCDDCYADLIKWAGLKESDGYHYIKSRYKEEK